MSRWLSSVALVLAAAVSATAGTDTDVTLLERLGDPSQRVREQALRRLRLSDDLDAETVARALTEAPAEALPTLLELAGTRGFAEVAPRVAELATGDDPLAAEAAIRCLVMLGEDAVALGLVHLPSDDPAVAARRLRLRALAAQDAIEQDVVSRWRRKGGTYEGRFATLERHGWVVQPVLLAMLLDVPLEDRFLALPENAEPSLTQRFLSLREVLRSQRRGYRTFRPLPPEIDSEDLFDLSAQALMDVADMEILGDVLDGLAGTLDNAHRRYRMLIGFQLRPWEQIFSDMIGEILAAHDRKERLSRRAAELEREARNTYQAAMRRPAEQRAEYLQWYATDLGRLASVLHRMREFDRAAEVYEEAIRVSIELGGKPPAISTYNRACALARAGRNEEALEQLDISLRSDLTDLTREWVEEDGDLRSLRDDPRFQKILDTHFGPKE
jgi:tetratricopeptide (TPR) repeat protein